MGRIAWRLLVVCASVASGCQGGAEPGADGGGEVDGVGGPDAEVGFAEVGRADAAI